MGMLPNPNRRLAAEDHLTERRVQDEELEDPDPAPVTVAITGLLAFTGDEHAHVNDPVPCEQRPARDTRGGVEAQVLGACSIPLGGAGQLDKPWCRRRGRCAGLVACDLTRRRPGPCGLRVRHPGGTQVYLQHHLRLAQVTAAAHLGVQSRG